MSSPLTPPAERVCRYCDLAIEPHPYERFWSSPVTGLRTCFDSPAGHHWPAPQDPA